MLIWPLVSAARIRPILLPGFWKGGMPLKQHKLKLLFDMEQLAVSGGHGTGIVRVADELLRGLVDGSGVEVYPLATSNRGNVRQYIQSSGLGKHIYAIFTQNLQM